MVTAKDFIEKVLIPLQQCWGYIYGTWGTIWTAAKQLSSTREMTVKSGSKWIGSMVTDCSGLIRWALKQLGVDIVHHARYQYTDYCTRKGKLINGRREDGTPILPGTAVFLQGKEKNIHHVGVYVGNDTVVEAKGTIYGVVTSHLNHWDHWGELDCVDYTDAAALETGDPTLFAEGGTVEAEAGTILKAVVNNPQQWLNVRQQPESEAKVLFQVAKGSTVDVLDAGEPDWWQIRYGSQIGWAWAKYLSYMTPLSTEPVNEPETAEKEPTLTDGNMETLIQAIDKLDDVLTEIKQLINAIKGR